MAGKLSAHEAAVVCGVSERTIRNWIASGKLPAEKTAAGFRVDAEDLAGKLPTTAASVPESSAGIAELVGLVDRLQRENRDLAGMVGSLQQRLVFADDRIRALEAPAASASQERPFSSDSDGVSVEPIQTLSKTPQRAPRWQFWRRATA